MPISKILVTGAGGFIGQHVCHDLFQQNYQIIACTNNKTINLNSTTKQTHVFNLPNERFVSLLTNEKPNYLIHCAGTASVSNSFLTPEKDFHNNVTVTEFILNTLVKNSPQTKVIFLSSAAVYGNPIKLPINEQTPTQPISPYGIHKLKCESLCKEYHQAYDTLVTILRPFSVYGPGLKKQLLWDIVQKSLNNDVILLHGTGNETRDFVYVNDLTKVIHKAIQYSDFSANIINVATGNAVTIKKAAELLIKKINSSKSIQFNGQNKTGDPLMWIADTASTEKLGMDKWLPIDAGIQLYLEWLNSEREIK